jgi:hypothetical protein
MGAQTLHCCVKAMNCTARRSAVLRPGASGKACRARILAHPHLLLAPPYSSLCSHTPSPPPSCPSCACVRVCVPAGGGSPPWVPRSVSPKIPWLDRAAIALFDKFARSAIKTGHLRFVLPSGEELCYGDAAATAAPVPKGAPRPAVAAAQHCAGTSEKLYVPAGRAAEGAVPSCAALPLKSVPNHRLPALPVCPMPAGEEWRGRPALSATVRLYDASFFRKVITRHDTGAGQRSAVHHWLVAACICGWGSGSCSWGSGSCWYTVAA